jgi:hypothetical protein
VTFLWRSLAPPLILFRPIFHPMVNSPPDSRVIDLHPGKSESLIHPMCHSIWSLLREPGSFLHPSDDCRVYFCHLFSDGFFPTAGLQTISPALEHQCRRQCHPVESFTSLCRPRKCVIQMSSAVNVPRATGERLDIGACNDSFSSNVVVASNP